MCNMRKILVGLSGLTFLLGLVACAGGPGDVPTQRGASLSSGGVSQGGATGGSGSSNGNGSSNGGDETDVPPPAECQLGSQCDCDGQSGIVTSCDEDKPTCTCVSSNADAG